MAITDEYEHAERVVAEVALLSDMATGKLDERDVKEAAKILLEHRRSELSSVSVAVAARLMNVSRTTVEAWRSAGILTPTVRRRRHEVTVESLIRLQTLVGELRRLGRMRELREYVWWSAQDAADHADGQLAEALRQLAEEYAPSEEDLQRARREMGQAAREET